MPALSEDRIAELLSPYFAASGELVTRLSAYLDFLLKWNAKTNLTAIRTPEGIVTRHFGESLFAARHLGECPTVLDLGSGAGFPGLPVALVHSGSAVTLAESQHKKAAFLREAVRTLGLANVEVWAGRAEDMPADRRFDTVTLRAVDNMPAALAVAEARALRQIVVLTTRPEPELPAGLAVDEVVGIPGTEAGVVLRAVRGTRVQGVGE